MERYDIQVDLTRNTWGLKKRDDGQGMFVYAEEAIGYRNQYRMAMVVLIAVCVTFAVFLLFHSHDPQPVQKISEEEYQRAIQEQRRLQIELSATQKRAADLKAATDQYKKMLQTSNANNAKLVQQLKEVQVSVPTLPIIQKALYDEAKTDAGLKAAMVRNFGREIAGRIEVR